MLGNGARAFREVCLNNGIGVTHQRQVLYEVMKTMHSHPSPEEVYAQEEGAAISLATVYKKHTFICGERGLLRGEHASWLAARGDE